jgi:tetratricopeptide (TPR) repeat protein
LPFEARRIAGAALLLLSGLAGCARSGDPFLEPLLEMDGSGNHGQAVADRRIREIQQAIRRYRREVERTVKASAQLEVYYKMLAAAYMQQGMFQPAYEALQEAMAIQSANPILAYYAAVCSASLSKAQVEEAARSQWLQRSEGYYRRALDLDPGYVNALYGLAVLYVFELQRPQEAAVLLERLLKRDSRNTAAELLLGNAYYRSGRLEDALGVFRDVAAPTDAQRQEAQANAQRIEEELHGAP